MVFWTLGSEPYFLAFLLLLRGPGMNGFCVWGCSATGMFARKSVTTMSPGFNPLFTSALGKQPLRKDL